MESRRFTVTVSAAGRGGMLVPVPFDPNAVWGTKRRHHVTGTVNGVRVRPVIEAVVGIHTGRGYRGAELS